MPIFSPVQPVSPTSINRMGYYLGPIVEMLNKRLPVIYPRLAPDRKTFPVKGVYLVTVKVLPLESFAVYGIKNNFWR